MNIRISEKYGVNPSINVCFYCNKEKNEIILPGRLPGDVEAPHRAVWNKEPCDECKKWMAQGIICISVKDGESGDNPYRTGKWSVIREEALKRIITDQTLLDGILKSRVVFIEDEVWRKLFP